MRFRVFIALALFATSPSTGTAQEYFWRDTAYPDLAIRGPAATHGALLYNQGRGVEVDGRGAAGDSFHLAPPAYVRKFHGAGWDLFKLNRKWAADNESSAIAAVHAEIARLRTEGYRRIVLAGQSYGAWLSVLAATRDGDLHAIIATAPGTGYGGVSVDGTALNAQKLVDFSSDLKPVRAAMFFFDGDPRDVAWLKRGERVRQALEKRQVPNFIVDRPPHFSGHGGANGGLFALRYGDCLTAFVAPTPLSDTFACDPGRSPADIVLQAAGVKDTATTASFPGALAPFAGRWYGEFTNGALRVFVPHEILSPTQMRATYGGVGAVATAERSFASAVTATFDGQRLIYRSGTIDYFLQPRTDGGLDGEWRRVDGTASGKATYRRLP